MPTVTLELESRPESLIVVRGMLVAVGDLLGFDVELIHNLKTVVGEACNNVVLHAYDGEPGPLAVSLAVTPDGVEVIVRDWGRGIREVAPTGDRSHVGLAVISTLTDRVRFIRVPGGGTEVRMAFSGRPVIDAVDPQPRTEAGGEIPLELSGDAVGTLSPVGLLSGVLARVATGLAARAHFSLDRFCDVYLVTDALAAHAGPSAIGERLGFAVAACDRRLDLTVGPFRAGSADELLDVDGLGPLGSALSMLAVDLAVEPVAGAAAGAEMWRLAVLDGHGSPAALSGP